MANTARLVLLDAQAGDALHPFREEDLLRHVPDGLEPLPTLRLSDFGAPSVKRRPPDARPVDWRGLGKAVMALLEAARAQGRDSNPPTHTIVGGQSPLPVFALMGQAAWGGGVTLVNQRRDGTWDALRLGPPAPPGRYDPFDASTPLPRKPSLATGLVAVYVGTRGFPADPGQLDAFCKLAGRPLAAVVDLCSRTRLTIDAGNARAVFDQIERTLTGLQGAYHQRDGLALFVDGPATLAFMVGRAVNPNVSSVVHVPDFDDSRGAYEPAFTLPWGAARAWPRSAAEIVLVSANPDLPEGRLALDAEYHAIQHKLRLARHRDALKLVPWPAARPDDLLQALNQHAPAIVHFSGHGRPDGVVLLDDAGEPHVATHAALVKLFGLFADSVRLVVLGTCFGDGPARAIAQEIDCVVGMPADVEDEAARTFAAAFYSALGFGESVGGAFEQGCAALALHGLPAASQPRLVTKAGVDPAQVHLIESARASRA